MKKSIIFTLLMVILGCTSMMAQNTVNLVLNNSTHDTIYEYSHEKIIQVVDDGGLDGVYTGGHDFWTTVKIECDSTAPDDTVAVYRACVKLNLQSFDVDCRDTLYVYDGTSITDPLLVKRNNCYSSNPQETFYISTSNPNSALTIRFKTGVRTGDEVITSAGFNLNVKCEKLCEYVVAVIDTMYHHVDLKTGRDLDTVAMKMVPAAIDSVFYTYDSIVVRYDSTRSLWYDKDTTIVTDSLIRVDTLGYVRAALLCQGQGVRFSGHGEYTHTTGYYNPTDATTLFRWDLGGTEYARLGATKCVTDIFQNTQCYNVTLSLVDSLKCRSNIDSSIQVRVALNPIKTIFDLDAICNNDSLLVNVGYDGGGTLNLRKIKFYDQVTKTNEVRTFIPDGPSAGAALADPCFAAPVTFTEFPGQKIKSADDICSICINYEHTYMGDYRIAIRCPTYNGNISETAGQAVLKYGKQGNCNTCDPLAPADSPDGTMAGSNDDTGCPIGSDGSVLDSLQNPFGLGLDYCWSRNGSYKLITGHSADDAAEVNEMFISNTTNRVDYPAVYPTIPAYFTNMGGQTPAPGNHPTRTPSDHEGKLDYYRPASDFSELVGCPLNGDWKAVICDFWPGDNGWVFNWSMDICGAKSSDDCQYQVALDSVLWLPDTSRIDHDLEYSQSFYHNGKYAGININHKPDDPTAAFISSPDTAGQFSVKISLFDEFGCRWDTATNIITVVQPLPRLGNDTVICDVATTILDARDRYSDSPLTNYSYIWEPFGQTTPTIETTPDLGQSRTYIVEVLNEMYEKRCPARDTIVVDVKAQPIPNFDPGFYPLEGCEPLTINFTNTTTDGYKYRWVFGDGTYSTLMNPSHTYPAGTYSLKYYVESDGGCKDSLIYDSLITVFPQPHAAFSWEPTFPTVLHPSITLSNGTTPDDGSNLYFWEIQYDKNDPYNLETFTDRNPTYTWSADNGEDVSGTYNVRLIARTDKTGPSGILHQCGDTIENTILIINDDLQFPNVVTPNGDGLNDRFVIKNLVEGLAYPINSLDIYDKWGSRVFHADNISKDEDFWDPGRSNVPAGTYFYRFTAKGYKGNIEHNGVIEVLK